MAPRLTDEDRRLRAIPEKTLQSDIMQLARMTGWKVCHFSDSRKMVRRGSRYIPVPDPDAAGFPDLILLRPPVTFVIEVKKELGRVEPNQVEWLDLWRGCGADVMVARPSNWDEVQRKLTAPRPLS